MMGASKLTECARDHGLINTRHVHALNAVGRIEWEEEEVAICGETA